MLKVRLAVLLFAVLVLSGAVQAGIVRHVVRPAVHAGTKITKTVITRVAHGTKAVVY